MILGVDTNAAVCCRADLAGLLLQDMLWCEGVAMKHTKETDHLRILLEPCIYTWVSVALALVCFSFITLSK